MQSCKILCIFTILGKILTHNFVEAKALSFFTGSLFLCNNVTKLNLQLLLFPQLQFFCYLIYVQHAWIVVTNALFGGFSTLQILLLFFLKTRKKYLSLEGLSVEGEENRCGKFSGQEQAVCVDCPFLTTLW